MDRRAFGSVWFVSASVLDWLRGHKPQATFPFFLIHHHMHRLTFYNLVLVAVMAASIYGFDFEKKTTASTASAALTSPTAPPAPIPVPVSARYYWTSMARMYAGQPALTFPATPRLVNDLVNAWITPAIAGMQTDVFIFADFPNPLPDPNNLPPTQPSIQIAPGHTYTVVPFWRDGAGRHYYPMVQYIGFADSGALATPINAVSFWAGVGGAPTSAIQITMSDNAGGVMDNKADGTH